MGDASEVPVRLSLYNPETDSFLSHVTIGVSGDDFDRKTTTDEEGLATIVLPGAGDFRVVMNDNKEFHAELTITIK